MVSLFQVFGHRPVSEAADECYWLAQTIGQEVQSSPINAIDKTALASLTYDVLSRYDDIAATLYGVKHGVVQARQNQKPRRGRPRQHKM